MLSSRITSLCWKGWSSHLLRVLERKGIYTYLIPGTYTNIFFLISVWWNEYTYLPGMYTNIFFLISVWWDIRTSSFFHSRAFFLYAWIDCSQLTFFNFFYKKLKNVSCEYDRVNGWNSTLQAAWYIRYLHKLSFARVLCFIFMKDIGRWLPWMLPGSTGRFSITILCTDDTI